MRRFSQRNALVTLSEINITPLLDLAFVLLIIFIITTPLLEQSIPMSPPKGGAPDRPRDKRDVRTVEISSKGRLLLQPSKDGPGTCGAEPGQRRTAQSQPRRRSAC